MDDKLNEDVNMLIVVKGICAAYPLVVALVPQMDHHVTTLGGKIEAIKDQAQKTGISIRGLYTVKGQSKERLVTLTDAGNAALRSLANETNDPDMKAKAAMKAYQLEKLHKNDLITKSKEMQVMATSVSAQLANHGFSAADLTEWQDAYDDFLADSEQPRVGQEVHKSDLATLKKMVADALRWMNDVMDDTAIAFKRKDPAFFQLYKFSREKHHQGHRKSSTGEDVVNPGEYVLEIGRAGGMARVGFPVLPDVTYLIENLKSAPLKFWAQATQDAPAATPTDAAVLAVAEELQRKGSDLGAPAKPYLFFANEDAAEDGQVAINAVEDEGI